MEQSTLQTAECPACGLHVGREGEAGGKWLPAIDGEENTWVVEEDFPSSKVRAVDGCPVDKSSESIAKERPPSLRERALGLARERGAVRTRDFEAIGVPRQYPRMMCKEGLLKQVAFGTYCLADGAAELTR
jgi:hypothetical protein